MAEVGLVLAVADNGVIGHRGRLPWHLPADLARFKRVTMGHPILMGRRTFAAIGRPLPGRRNLVLSSRPGTEPVEWFTDLDEALAAVGEQRVFVIGGVELFRRCWPLADLLHLTRVHARPVGDTVFEPDLTGWRLTSSTEYTDDPIPCTVRIYRR